MKVVYRTVTGRPVTCEFNSFAEAIEAAYEIQRGQLPFRVFAAICAAVDDTAGLVIGATKDVAKVIVR
jgi:hypothetical protein